MKKSKRLPTITVTGAKLCVSEEQKIMDLAKEIMAMDKLLEDLYKFGAETAEERKERLRQKKLKSIHNRNLKQIKDFLK